MVQRSLKVIFDLMCPVLFTGLEGFETIAALCGIPLSGHGTDIHALFLNLYLCMMNSCVGETQARFHYSKLVMHGRDLKITRRNLNT